MLRLYDLIEAAAKSFKAVACVTLSGLSAIWKVLVVVSHLIGVPIVSYEVFALVTTHVISAAHVRDHSAAGGKKVGHRSRSPHQGGKAHSVRHR